MNEQMNIGSKDTMASGLWARPTEDARHLLIRESLQAWSPLTEVAGNPRTTEAAMDNLVSAYLAANLDFKCTPLKELMDDFEGRVLRKCLILTQGHQRNAAAILGLKCTALFEKMRKHGINGRQMKLALRLGSEPPPKTR